LLNDFFLRRLAVSAPYEFACYIAQTIESSLGLIRMAQVSGEVGYSIRSVDRTFRQCFGVSPKFYARIIRFQQVIKLLSGSSADLTDIAMACGYYDQSHLAREFTDFAGQSPSAYRAVLLERAATPPPNLVQFLQAE
jgi:transcriptional regulator GlxA family with amidase domain